MQINESRKLLLSDTPVPDIFIAEYLPSLSGLAVKIYIYLLLAAKSEKTITEQDLAGRMAVDEEEIRTALLELGACQLIIKNDDKITIQDIKAAEIEKIYRPRTSIEPTEAVEMNHKYTLREKLMADISKTFFQGLMSPSWYGEIDTWFERYEFDPEVIYALFQECARRGKLNSKIYISRVAENWSARGVKTYQHLNQYFLDYDKIKKVSRNISKKMRKTMTEYDEEMISRWVETMGYDFDIIELALRKTVKIANPNLAYIDKILEEWFSHQLKTSKDVQAYEDSKQKRYSQQKKSVQADGSRQKGNIGNFVQRDYSDDYLSEFYEDINTQNKDANTPDHSQNDTEINDNTAEKKQKDNKALHSDNRSDAGEGEQIQLREVQDFSVAKPHGKEGEKPCSSQ